MQDKIIWAAKEFRSHNKTAIWYLVFTAVSVGLITYAYFSHNILTLLTFALLIAVAFIFSHQKPHEIEYQLTTTSIVIGQLAYPYRNIKKFWIIYTPENKTVNFETVAYLNNHISMELGKQDPVRIKQFLKNYLQEDLDRQESFTDILARKIKF